MEQLASMWWSLLLGVYLGGIALVITAVTIGVPTVIGFINLDLEDSESETGEPPGWLLVVVAMAWPALLVWHVLGRRK